MYLCKHPITLGDRDVRPGEKISDKDVAALPIINRQALINRGWLVELDAKGEEPNVVMRNHFAGDWNYHRQVQAQAADHRSSKARLDGGRLTGDVDDAILARQRSEDVALSPEGLDSLLGPQAPMPDFEDMESLPDTQRERIKAGKSVEDTALDADAQTIDDVETYPAEDASLSINGQAVQPIADARVHSTPVRVEGHECPTCARLFESARGLSVHAAREHGG